MSSFHNKITDDVIDFDDDQEIPLAVPLSMESRPQPPHLHPQIQHESSMPMDTSTTYNNTAAPPVPVLLLTGYLGAGKTTLVNYILTAKHGYRCAVLLNEFGDTADVEKALVKEPEGHEAAPLTDWVQLENGCICCSVKNDMVKALESLMQQRDRFDYIIIETTGLANPGPVAAALWTDEELESSICLDAIVTVVDSKNILRHIYEEKERENNNSNNNKSNNNDDGIQRNIVNEAQQQVAFADVILLNKIDLVNETDLIQIESDILKINSDAKILRCQKCEIDLGYILHTGLYTAGTRPITLNSENDGYEEGDLHSSSIENIVGDVDTRHHHDQHVCDGHECTHQAHQSAHDPAIRTVTLRTLRPVDLKRVRYWLDEVLWENTIDNDASETLGVDFTRKKHIADIFRVKGLLYVYGSDKKYVLQAVHEIYDVIEGPFWDEEKEIKGSKIVFIGRYLDEYVLQKGFDTCCY